MRNFEAKNAKEVERIQHAAGSACMYESFLESGPQCVVQLPIILSTGSISYSQMISLPVSVLSLSWSSSRAYFIFRNKDNSDPDPKMVATRIFPWMLVVVIHSLTVWTCIVELLGEYVFVCILTYFCAAFAFQISINRYINKSQQVVCNALLVSFGIFSTIPNLYAVAKFPVQESSVRLRTAACLCGILTMIIFTFFFLQEVNEYISLFSNQTSRSPFPCVHPYKQRRVRRAVARGDKGQGDDQPAKKRQNTASLLNRDERLKMYWNTSQKWCFPQAKWWRPPSVSLSYSVGSESGEQKNIWGNSQKTQ